MDAQAELGQLVLKRVLLLALLLDRAVTVQHAQASLTSPLLFCGDAPVKSSCQVCVHVPLSCLLTVD